MKEIAAMIALALWIAGVVIAKGFWSTLIALIFPFWAWYLVLERIMFAYGILS